MFEFIGIVTVCFILFNFLRGFARAKTTSRIGKEARDYAVNSLRVPEAEYNKILLNNIEQLKQHALYLANIPSHSQDEWANLLAHAVNDYYIYQSNTVCPADNYQAIRWTIKSIAHGNEEACYSLSILNSRVGQHQNSNYWQQQAVEQGHVDALYAEGWNYYYCRPIYYNLQQDEGKAFKYFCMSADQGHAEGQEMTATYYQYGVSSEAYPQDNVEAFNLAKNTQKSVHYWNLVLFNANSTEEMKEQARDAIKELTSIVVSTHTSQGI